MIDPAPATARAAYDLYDLQDGKRFFWRNPSHGVALFDAGRDSAIVWRNEAIEVGGAWPFWRIAERNRPRARDPRHPPGELTD